MRRLLLIIIMLMSVPDVAVLASVSPDNIYGTWKLIGIESGGSNKEPISFEDLPKLEEQLQKTYMMLNNPDYPKMMYTNETSNIDDGWQGSYGLSDTGESLSATGLWRLDQGILDIKSRSSREARFDVKKYIVDFVDDDYMRLISKTRGQYFYYKKEHSLSDRYFTTYTPEVKDANGDGYIDVGGFTIGLSPGTVIQTMNSKGGFIVTDKIIQAKYHHNLPYVDEIIADNQGDYRTDHFEFKFHKLPFSNVVALITRDTIFSIDPGSEYLPPSFADAVRQLKEMYGEPVRVVDKSTGASMDMILSWGPESNCPVMQFSYRYYGSQIPDSCPWEFSVEVFGYGASDRQYPGITRQIIYFYADFPGIKNNYIAFEHAEKDYTEKKIKQNIENNMRNKKSLSIE